MGIYGKAFGYAEWHAGVSLGSLVVGRRISKLENAERRSSKTASA